MNNPSELAHNAIVFGFALIGAVGVPGVLLLFVQMMIGSEGGVGIRSRR
jgi:hypothetical protein